MVTNRVELLQIADAVAREKSIGREIILSLMEEAIQKAARSLYGAEHDIRASIHPQTGQVSLVRVRTVVPDGEEEGAQHMSLSEAQHLTPPLKSGEEVSEELPSMDFSRIAAKAAKQVIMQRIHEAERERQYQEFKDRINEVVSGVIRRVEYGNVVVDIGLGEGSLRRFDTIPHEIFKVGDRVRALIQDVRRDNHAYQVSLSRTHPLFVAKLFAQEVPEIYDGIVEVKTVARDPGSRSKMAVFSRDDAIDPVGSCVGMRGARVQAVVNEIQGEKIEIILWDEDPASFIINAMSPAEISKVIMDEENKRVEVVIPDEQFSLAIGRRGQNVRLASKLTGWYIDVLKESDEAQRRQEELSKRTEAFSSHLGLDGVFSHLLASEGFASIEDVAYVDAQELQEVTNLEIEEVQSLQEKASLYVQQKQEELEEECRSLGVNDDLLKLEGLSLENISLLAKEGVLSLEDFGGLVPDDLTGYASEAGHVKGFLEGPEMNRGRAIDLIMRTRRLLGWIAPETSDEEKEEKREGDEGRQTL